MPSKEVERHPRILLTVLKNTSVLDYTLPLLWKIKQVYPGATVSVLYCTLDRRQILKESKFYSELFGTWDIQEYDFGDSLRDLETDSSTIGSPRVTETDAASSELLSVSGSKVAALIGNVQSQLAQVLGLTDPSVRVERILNSLNPDIILFDNRSVANFPGRNAFYAYCARSRKPVVLLPHAPHHTGTEAFTPFDEHGERLPDYCQFWMPFRFDRSWQSLPRKRPQFAYVGYPGLDSEWLTWVQSGGVPVRKGAIGHTSGGAPVRCLFIVRKFLKSGQTRPPGHDAYVFDYDEFTYFLNLVGDAFRQVKVDIEILVKPHPSNDLASLSEVFEASSISNWRIADDSIYTHLNQIDLVISLYSTTLLIPAMAGLPVILIHSRIQDEIHRWDEMRQLYTRLRFYARTPEALQDRLSQALKLVPTSGSRTERINSDEEHLRRFYPDGAMRRALAQLEL